MKFLKGPRKQKDKEGNWILYLENNLGDIYYLKEYQTWKNVGIAQEPGGHYAIIKTNNLIGSEFIYKKVQSTKQYLIAFYKEEMDSRNHFYIYNSGGAKITYEWENETAEGNGFIRIWESGVTYFVDSKRRKVYSKYHPKYWVKRLH